MDTIRVGVVDEHEIFRRGLVACLEEDPMLEVAVDQPTGPVPHEVDVAVVSPTAARQIEDCPLVVCADGPFFGSADDQLLAILPRRELAPEQLVSAVRAAAVGLQVVPPDVAGEGLLDERSLHVLRLLAGGALTREIAAELGYSERTIKGVIQEIERELGARNRAQAVAEGVRQGLI